MATFWVLPVCLLLDSVCPLSPQDSPRSSPQDPAQNLRQDARPSRYGITLPEGWRQLTPDEARTLRPKLPADMHELRPGVLDRFGQVDKWLGGSFDGRCLTVAQMKGEPSLDAEALATIRSRVEERGTYVSGKVAAVGPNNHPVLEVVIRIQPEHSTKAMQALEIYAPTGGRMIILEFRAYEDDFATALPLFRKALGTLIFAREPKGPPKLSDRLQNAAIVGAIVGLILLVLYKWSRN